MSKTLSIACALALFGALPGCATSQVQPTPEQLAACEKMVGMGEGATHSHVTDKTGMTNTMGLTHAQCRSMLRR